MKPIFLLLALCSFAFAQKQKTFNTEDQSWYMQDLGNFTWDKAMTACPSGWRLPADEDWKKLEGFLAANPKLQDEFRKNAKIREKASPAEGLKASAGYWWSATETTEISSGANFQFLYDGYTDFYSGYDPKYEKRAVRCVKDL
ncbi:MAG: fibrobacter succinogenes major paralogous domain-containing protein [Fibromonadales bacterium]|nr:fibrobacter succinogenes major paralogous domain-containing protein [Fibromonadales bacterium]